MAFIPEVARKTVYVVIVKEVIGVNILVYSAVCKLSLQGMCNFKIVMVVV